MDTNMVSPMPEMAPMAEFDKSPPSPMELSPPATAPLDDLPPPPTTNHSAGQSPKNETYQNWPQEGIIVNALAMTLVGLGILLSYVVRRDSLRFTSDYYDSERL